MSVSSAASSLPLAFRIYCSATSLGANASLHAHIRAAGIRDIIAARSPANLPDQGSFNTGNALQPYRHAARIAGYGRATNLARAEPLPPHAHVFPEFGSRTQYVAWSDDETEILLLMTYLPR